MPVGTPLYALADGEVDYIREENYPTGTKEIVIRADSGDRHLYTHTSRRDVVAGQRVTAGQRIGLSGDPTGLPHLHFEHRVRDGGTSSGWRIVDPVPLLTGAADVTYHPSNPIAGDSRGKAVDWIAYFEDAGAARIDDLAEYVETVYAFAPKIGLGAHKVITQGVHETSTDDGPFTSHWWRTRLNPAGIGITGDPAQNDRSRVFPSGRSAALAQMVHMCLYVFGHLPEAIEEYRDEDPRADAIPATALGKRTTLESFGASLPTITWAADPKYGEKWARTLNALEPVFAGAYIPADPEEPEQPEEPDEPEEPEEDGMDRNDVYVVIVAGHRSTGDPGDPTERDRTDELAVAYTREFREAGYEADWFQRDLDRDSNPTMTHGTLTTVSVGARNAIVNSDEPLVIMLDLHYNGRHSVVHSIVPDNIGLRTAFAGGDLETDTAANNTLDVALASAISKGIAAATGLGIFHGRLAVPGVMSERETGVALNGNWRLGMFAATAQQRMKAIRLVVEHAGWGDTETLRPGFEDRCATAAVAAVNATLGIATETPEEPEPEPEPKPETPDEPTLDYPVYLNRKVATRLFGEVSGDDDRVYGFNERGPVSNLWLDRGRQVGQFPTLREVFHDAGHKYFAFDDGTIIVDPEGEAEAQYVGTVEAVTAAIRDVLK